MLIDREVLLNAFRPSDALDDPALFAGRDQNILALTDAILTQGSIPFIYGSRGLGKTSLGLQMARIALGDVTLLGDLKAPERALREEQRFTVFWVNCSDATNYSDTVVQRMVQHAEMYSSVPDLAARRLSSSKETTKVLLKFVEHESEKTYDYITRAPLNPSSLEDSFRLVTDLLFSAGHSRLLFILDEFDRVEHSAGFAAFLRNHSSGDIKFCLIGIGHSVSTLLADHESIERALFPVRVRPMDQAELELIIIKASKRLADAGISMPFDDVARQRIARLSGGYPWFVHILGCESLLIAVDQHAKRVDSTHVETAVARLAKNRFLQEFADRYDRAVGESYHREVLLRLFAKSTDEDIPVSVIYPIAAKLGVTNPSACRTDLMRRAHGEILVIPPHRDKGIVRFRNSLFKRYVVLRSSVYDGLRDKVEEAWKQAVAPPG